MFPITRSAPAGELTRRLIRTVLAVVATPVALAILTAPAILAQGRIIFDHTRHDFGEVAEGNKAVHAFTFRNEGDAPFRLTDVRASCGCTTPEWTRDELAPGDSGQVTVVYDSNGRPGRFDKTVAVYSTAEPDLAILSISGLVSAALEDGVRQGSFLIDASTYTFSTVWQGGRLAHTFVIKNAGSDPVSIRDVRFESDALDVESPPGPISPDEVVQIRVLLDTKEVPPGPYDFTVRLETTDAAQPVKSLRLQGRVEPAGRR